MLDDLISPDWLADDGLRVTNPATGEMIASVREVPVAEATRMIERAKAAMPGWAGRTAKARAAILRRWFELVMHHQEALARLVTAECGKPLGEARGEVAYAASFIEWFAEEARRVYGDIIPAQGEDKRILVLKQPIGVSAAITPWNFPVAMITRKAAPALAAGCPMLVKPPRATPLSALALHKLAHEAGVPADILAMVPTARSSEIGNLFCDSPAIAKLSFTGSTETGKQLAARAAGTVKKVSLELGGNAPFIVFDDADLEAAVEGAIASKFRNAGQTCVCANRFLVQDGVHDAFVEKLGARIAALKVGNGADDGVAVGPLIDSGAVAKVEELVGEALSRGARAITGGTRHAAGENFFAPTLLTGITSQMAVVHEEIFGPVAPVQRFSDDDEAIRLANDTPYGLAAYFYARDMRRIWRVMEGLDYGMVGINEGIISTEVAPFGGVKQSGIGREGSRYGIDEYLEMKYALLGGV